MNTHCFTSVCDTKYRDLIKTLSNIYDGIFFANIVAKSCELFSQKLSVRDVWQCSKPVMLCTIWYHLYNLKNMKNTHGGMLLLALACNFTKNITSPCVFFTFFKLYKWYQTVQRIKYTSYIQSSVKSGYVRWRRQETSKKRCFSRRFNIAEKKINATHKICLCYECYKFEKYCVCSQ